MEFRDSWELWRRKISELMDGDKIDALVEAVTELMGLYNRVAELESTQRIIINNVGNLNQRVDGVIAELADIDTIRSDIGALKDDMVDVKAAVQMLDGDVTSINTDIDNIDETFCGLYAVIDYGALSGVNNIKPVLDEQ